MQAFTHKIEQFEHYVVQDDKRYETFLFFSFLGFATLLTVFIVLVVKIVTYT